MMADLVDGERLRCRIINMRKLLLIFTAVIFISSCASYSVIFDQIQVSHPAYILDQEYNFTDQVTAEGLATYVIHIPNYDDVSDGTTTFRKRQAMSIETGQTFHIGSTKRSIYDSTVLWCERLYKSKCVESRAGLITYYENLEDYKNKTAAEQKRTAEERKRQAIIAENNRKQDAIDAEQRKQELLTQLIERCTEYGFTGENNIATCVQNEAFNDRRLAQQRYEFQTQLAQQAKIAQETQEALEAQLAMNKASEEVTFLQIFLEAIADYDWATHIQLANQQKQINALARRPR